MIYAFALALLFFRGNGFNFERETIPSALLQGYGAAGQPSAFPRKMEEL